MKVKSSLRNALYFKISNSRMAKASAAVGSMVAAGVANAQQAVDLTATQTQIGHANTGVAEIGQALLILAALAMTFRWLKASFF